MATAKEPLTYKNRVVKEFAQKLITEQFDFGVTKHQQRPVSASKHEPQLPKQLKRPANFLTARQQMDEKHEVKKIKREEKKTIGSKIKRKH